MTLIDLFGESFFFIKESGYRVKRVTYNTTEGVFFENNNSLYYKEIGNNEVTYITDEVNIWTVLHDGNVIYSFNYYNGCEDNTFCISNKFGNRVACGAISPDGRLVFVHNNFIYEMIVNQKPKVLIDEEYPANCVQYSDDTIFAFVNFVGTDITYPKSYDYSGNLLFEDTQKNLLRALNAHIWFGLVNWEEYYKLINKHKVTDEIVVSLYNNREKTFTYEINYENIARISDSLSDLKLLSSTAYSGYLKLKDLFLSCGINDNIEIPLATISCISQNNFRRKNNRIVTVQFIFYLKKLQKKTSKEEFLKFLYDSRMLLSQMEKDGEITEQNDED